eukprot:TRINITY_DN9357_c0_g1_i2.p1 TRINITY_DN9357_c0_g1~~TRINITY_DN9357_c0_g1_i2.p1  ORF type:complete len:664 (+),score=125.80 TRINITY_DN9357_c0_g1_i2:159-2150(+)
MQQRIEQEVQELFRLFRWKKYGNKEIKGGPVCRGYYFCRTCGLKLKIDYVKQITQYGEELNIIKKWELEDPKCHLPECCDHTNNANATLDSSDCSGVNNFQLLVDAAVDAYQGLDDGNRQHSDFETDQFELHSLEKSSCQTHSTIPEVEPRSEPPNTQLAARQAAEALIKGPLSNSSPSVQLSLNLNLNRKRKKTTAISHQPSLLFEFYEDDSEFEEDDDDDEEEEYNVNIRHKVVGGGRLNLQGGEDEGEDVVDDEYEDDEYEDDQVTYCAGKICEVDSDEYQPPTVNHRCTTSSSQSRMQKSTQDRLIVQQYSSNDRRTVLVLKENLKHYEGLEEYGYRKYGQKDIQGSLYPRSYHRCNRETCPARKQVQQIDNNTFQINYLYQHDHQPLDQSARHRRNRRTGKSSKSTRRKIARQTPRRKPKQNYQSQCRQQCSYQQQNRNGKTKQQLYSYRVLPLHLQDKLIHSAMQIASSQAYLNNQQGKAASSSMVGEQTDQQQYSANTNINNTKNQYSPNSTLHLPIAGLVGGEQLQLESEPRKSSCTSSLVQLLKESRESCRKQQQLHPLLQMPWGTEGQPHYDLNAALAMDEIIPGKLCQKLSNQLAATQSALFLENVHDQSEEEQQNNNSPPSHPLLGQDFLRKPGNLNWGDRRHNFESHRQE